jgi:transcriptional regulator with XRE-family HTH domain
MHLCVWMAPKVRTADDIEAGRLLKGARVRAGVGTAEAASAADVTEDMIFRYERGASWPTFQTLARLAACYRIAVGDFFPNSGVAPESELVAPLVTAMAGMREREQEELISYLTGQVRMMRSWQRRNDTGVTSMAERRIIERLRAMPPEEQDIAANIFDAGVERFAEAHQSGARRA